MIIFEIILCFFRSQCYSILTFLLLSLVISFIESIYYRKVIYISIVEGNPHLRSLLGWHLQQAGYITSQYSSIQQARQELTQKSNTLVILDSDLPDGDGVEFCRWLHKSSESLIFMLSARNTEMDVVKGLKAGADDYLRKPFGMQEFLARVESLLRRFRVYNVPMSLDFGDLQIDLVQRRVEYRGQLIDLTPQEFSLLFVLSQAKGAPLSRTELLQKAWPEEIENQRTIDTHVLSLRKKLELDPRQPNLIQTVRNVGYRFNLELLHQEKPSPSHPENHFTQRGYSATTSLENNNQHLTVVNQNVVNR